MSPMPRPQSRPGFTLLELVIALGVTAIALAGALAASTSQQRAYTSGQKMRSAQGSARAALLYLEQKLPMAGWGVDPSLAIDFQFYTTGPCPAAIGACSRDRTNDADEIMFYARNPSYWVPAEGHTGAYKGHVWNFVGISGTNARLDARNGDVFPKGQILQVVCPGELKYAYFTVGTRAAATADGQLDVPLQAGDLTNPFLRQDVAGALGNCRTFEIERYRFHVRPVSVGDNRYDPYLVLDRGVDWTGSANGSPDGVVDEKDEVLVAEGIEGLQVAYALANPALGQPGATTAIAFGTTVPATQALASAGDILETSFAGAANGTTAAVYAPSSFYSYRYSDPIRQTAHQANIRSVRIAILARSPEPDATAKANLVVDSTFQMLNQAGAPAWITGAPKRAFGTDGYQRVRVDATVNLPNLVVRSLPAY